MTNYGLRITIFLVIVISTFGFAPKALAIDYYVDAVLGNNTRTTTEAQNPLTPWKTITYAAATSSVGDAIRVAQGTYNAATGESFPINLTGRYLVSTSTLAATIDAGSTNAITLGANATIEGFDIKSTTTDKVIYVTGANANIISNRLTTAYTTTRTYDIDVADAGDNVLIQGNTIDAKTSKTIMLETGADNPIVKDNTLYSAYSYAVSVNVNWFTTRATIEGNTITADQALYFGNSCSNIDIRNNLIKPYSTDINANKGMFLRGTGAVASNEVRGYKSPDAANTGAIFIYDGTITVRNNTLVNNAVGVSNSYGAVTVKNNIISASPRLNSVYTDYNGSILTSVGVAGRNGYTTTCQYNNVFNNATNYSGSSITQSNENNACPRFVGPNNNNYHIYIDSPSRGTADDGGNRGRYEAVAESSGITAEAYVSTDGNDTTGDGSFAKPWRTVTKAAASTEGTIYVEAGTYNLAGNESFPIILLNTQKLTKYAGDSVTINSTGAGANHTLLTVTGTTIEGLSLTTDNTDSNKYTIAAYGSTLIKNNIITAAYRGFYLYGSYCTAEGNTLTLSNTSAHGIVVPNAGDNSTIRNNRITATADINTRGVKLETWADGVTVSGNTLEVSGFGIEVGGWVNNYNLNNNIIKGAGAGSTYGIYASAAYNGSISSNEVSNYATGIRAGCDSGTLTVYHNTVVKNTTGIYSADSATKMIRNNIVSSSPNLGSLPISGSYGIYHNGGTTTISYNDVWNNEANYYNTSAGSGDISQHPRFVNSGTNDYRLSSDSPCKTAGQGGTYQGRYPAVGATSGVTPESYVDDGGDDNTGDGSFYSPWRTITKGLGSTEGTVYVRQGTYTAGESFPLTVGAGQKLINYLTEIATIDSTGIAGKNTVQMGSNTTLEGLTVINAVTSGTYHAVYAPSSDVHIRNNKLYQNGNTTNSTTLYLTASGDRCSMEGNTATATADNYYAIQLESGADNPIIRNNTITGPHISGAALYFAGSAYPTVEGNTITGNYYGINLGGACTNMKIWSNKIIATGSNNSGGMFIGGAATGIIATNEVRGWNSGANSAGILFGYGGANLTLERNTLVKNKNGVTVNTGTVVLKNNILSAAPRGGTYVDESKGIYNNGGTVSSSYNQIFNNEDNYSGTISDKTQDLLTNPRFVNADTNDYRLYADSPCVSSGQNGVNRGAYAAIGSSSGITTESYVSESGSDDSGDGTFANPWRTVTKGLGSTEGTVYARQGTYKTSENFPITLSIGQKLIRYGTDIATIDSTGIAGKNTVQMGSNTTLEGMGVINAVTSGTYHAVYVISPDVHIRNNKLYQNGSVTDSNALRLTASADRCSMEGNTATATADNYYAIHLESGAENPIIRNNTITGPNISGAALYFAASAYPTVEGNTITGNYAGINLGGASTNVKIWSNKILATGSSHFGGIFIGGAATGIIATNEVRGWNSGANSAGILFWYGGANLTLERNTLVKNKNGVTINTGTVVLKNNILSAAPRGGTYVDESKGIYNTGGTVSSSYNQIFNNEDNYSGTISDKTQDLLTNPRFVNADTNDYRLYADSPCVSSGQNGVNRGAYAAIGSSSGITTESYVSESGSDDSGDGTFANPWRTVTKGLGSTEGTVYARQGTYKTSENFPITLSIGQKLINYLTEIATIDSTGIAGKNTVQMGSNTTLEGMGVINAVTSGTYHAVYVISPDVHIRNNKLYQNGSVTDSNALRLAASADRCSMEGNTATATADNYYAVHLESGADNPIVRNNTITGPNISGAALYFAASAYPTVEGNTITGNYAGIKLGGACTNVKIWNNKVLATGSSHFGGIYITGAATGIIATNEVRGWNSGADSSGILFWYGGANLTVNKNTIAKCRVGVAVGNGTVTVMNNIFASEVGGYSGSNTKGIDNNGGTVTSTYNDLYANDITYEGTVGDKTGDIQVDPVFVDATNNDYHLQKTSPCDGTGTPAGTDMGAYDYIPTAPTVTLSVPNGGETWKAGTWNNITWSTTNTPTSLNLYYITSEASGYQTIATGISDTGTYPWLVPNRATSTAKVSIEAVKAAEIGTDESNAVFTITAATDYYVNATTGSNTYNGLTSEVSGLNGPWKTITYAASMAASGTTIRVAAGTYNTTLGEVFAISLTGKKLLATSTGLATLDASVNRVVNLGTNSTIEGFTVKTTSGTSGDGALYASGKAFIRSNTLNCVASSVRAIYLPTGGANTEISSNNIYVSGSTSLGIRIQASNILVEDNIVEIGSSTASGGIYHYPELGGFVIRRNTVKGSGGGSGILTDTSSTGTYSGTISTNEVRGFTNGIAWRLYDGNQVVNIYNNTVVNNTTGIYCREFYAGGDFILRNNIVCGSSALGGFTTGTYGIYRESGDVTSTYNDVWNNVTNYYNVSAGTGDISSYPRFVNPAANDHRLYGDSPCATAGQGGTYQGCYAPLGATSQVTPESYISVSGSDDTGDGSFYNPWRTITKGLGSTEGTVYVRAGTYTAGETYSRSTPAALTLGISQQLKRYQAEAVTLDSGAAACHTVIAGANSTLEGVTISRTNTSTSYFGIDAYANAQIKSNTISAAVRGIQLSSGSVFVDSNTVTVSNSSAIGIYLTDPSDSSIISNNRITAWGSSSDAVGSASYANSITITGNTLEAARRGIDTNYDTGGGYIYSYNTIIGNNTAGSIGIYKYESAGTSYISSNEVRGFAKGINTHLGSGTCYILNNTLVNNTTGIYNERYGTKYFKNNIISASPKLGTYTTGTKGFDHQVQGGTTYLLNNDLWNNETNYNGIAAGTGDISKCPRFIDPNANDYRIGSDSPCVNAGEGGTYQGRYAPLGTTSGITTESYVSESGNDVSGNGTVGTPWRTITKGLGSTEGTVYVMAGTYTAGESFPLIASYGQGISRYLTAIATIDSGSAGVHTLYLTNNTTLEGLTIQSSTTTDTRYVVYVLGANVRILNSQILQTATSGSSQTPLYVSATGDNCLIQGNNISGKRSNVLQFAGGANNPIIRNNTISNACSNVSSPNAVEFAACTAPTLEGNTISAIYSSSSGVYQGASCTTQDIRNNMIVGPGGNSGTSGIRLYGNGTVSSNEVRGWGSNSGASQGNGIYTWNGGTFVIDRNTLVKNRVGIYVEVNTTVKNNVIACEVGGYSSSGTTYGINRLTGTVTSTYNDIYAADNKWYGTGVASGEGDKARDPKFNNATGDDYHLAFNSPCIDAGDPASALDPDGSRADMGAYYFDETVTGTMAVYVKEPDGGNVLTGGSNYSLTWYATKEGAAYDHIELYYSTDGGAAFPGAISTSEANDGAYTWSVPNINTTQGRVRVVALGSAATDESDSNFTINQSITVTLKTPNGGETWGAGTWNNITWESGGGASSINLYYLTNEAYGYQTIAAGIADSGSYPWLVPNNPTSTAKVSIEAIWGSSRATDESNAYFTITGANDFYVNASTGSNSYNGLTSEVSGLNGPWKTITYSTTAAATSTTIHAAAGTYNAGESFPITITGRTLLATNTCLATIEETGSSNILMNLGANSVLDGFSLKGDGIVYVLSLSGNTVSIKNNIINADNYYSAIYSSGRSGVSVEGNVIHSMERTGLQIESADNVSVSRNEIRDHGSDFYFALYATGQNINIERNTIVRNYKNLYAMASGGPINIKNNIISNKPQLNDDYTLGCVGIQSGGGTINLSYNNVWKNYTNYDSLSPGATDISDFPGFVSPEAGDYRLQVSNAYWTNPCISAGEGGVDIGCYGSVEAGVPYRNTSYVSSGGNDATGTGTSEGAAWRTVTKANKHTRNVINVGSGLYNAAGGETVFPIKFSINRYVKGVGRDLATIEAGNSQDVAYLNSNSSIEGITLKGGTGACVVKGYGSVQVRNCYLNATNYSYGFDGYNYLNYATIEGCRITSANANGIILSSTVSFALIASNEVGNCVQNGIYSSANALIKKNLIYGSGYNYYGIYSSDNNTEIDRNTLVKNRTGIYANAGGGKAVNIKNNIIASEVGGYSTDTSRGIYSGYGTINSTYNDVFANDTNWSGVTSGEGDISRDPKLVNASSADYHLLYNSPCIDSGDPASSPDPDGTRADMGAYYFDETVTGTMAVYVKEPNGGNTLTGLIPYNITWYATKEGTAINHIELYYSTDGGTTFPNVIAGNTSNTGSYLWPVPNTPTSQARIRVIAVGSLATDESDSNFTILSGDSQGPTVEVTSPIGGELWKGGSTHNITFTATDEAGLKANSLYAWYSTNGGSTYPNVITREAVITSPFVWNIPASINSQTVKVRLNIWDAYDNIGTSESPASFTIDSTPPSVTVLIPSGGEKWQGGIDHSLNWSATDNFTLEANPITLQYSTNSGADYTTIITGEVNGGFFSWPTPSLNTNEAKVKILAQDVCGNVGSAEGGNFVIDIDPPTAPALLTPPNGSTTSDATTTFTWNASTDNLSGIASYEVIIDTDVVTIDATTSYTTLDALVEGLHTWRVKAKDGAGWWGSYSDTWGFTLDITTPEVLSITLKDRLNGSTQYSRYLTVSVEANGVTGVPVSMKLAQDSGFTDNATAWLAYADQTEYTLTAGEGSRTVYYKVRDAASNESTPVNSSITVDTVSPTVESFLMKDTTTGSTTESNSLTITVEAYGIQGSPTQMRIAQDSGFTTNSTGWVTYVPTTEYTFTAGDGPRPAYYQLRDIASNESNVVTQTIGIDTSGPSAAGIALKDRVYGSTQYTNSLTISLEVHDAAGSPIQMRTAQDSAFTVNATGWLTYATTSEYTFTADEGSRTAYFKMRDSAENEGSTYNASIIVDTQPPSQVTLLTPDNNSYTNDTTPTMTWNAATDVTSGVASYEVVIDTTQITTLGAVTTFTTADAESQGWHNWKARAKDYAQNWGDYSTTWNLTIETTNPTVTLGKPRGGQTLEATGSYNITWEAADDYGLKTNPVTLYFSSNAGASWSTIQAGIAYVTGEGTYGWTIPDVNSTQCRVSVEVEDLAGNKASNMSPANFTISNVQPTAVVLYPNGGEYLKGNTSYNITWAATVEVEPATINLRYSTNSGTSWTLIASNESNDGTYAWTTPSIDSTTCRVSIEAKDGLSRVITDQSNANFAIDSSNPGVTVVAPAGGERIAGGSSYNIQWTATDPVGFPTNAITLRYSTDSGGTWNLIAAGRPNTSPYAWTVPSVDSATCRVSVEATDYVGNTTGGMSASDFIIDSTTPVVTTVTPTNGATSVPINTQVIIVFSKEMSREVTQNAFSLTASPPVAGAFGWSADGKTLTFTPTAALEYNTLYTVGVAATATDMAGNHLAVFSSTFTTAQRGDTEAPHIIIQRVDSQGIANTLKDGDYIPKQPRFKGIITDNLGVSRASIKFYLDDLEVSAVITEVSATNYEVSYTATSNLEGETVRTHSVKLTAADIAANSSTKEVKELKVSYDSARVIGPVLTYPTTYNPLSGTPARIAYNLTADQDIMIYMFDISGQNVWTGKYPSGAEGGKAGYNEVPFYGRSEISGSALGNGIYVYKLVAGGRIIGTGRMAIF